MKEKKDVKGLIKALKYKDNTIREWAVVALCEIKDARAVEPLIEALKDEDSNVRWRAAEALKDIGDARAVEPLKQALKDEDELVTELLSRNLQIREKALTRVQELTKAGDRRGQIALEEAIRIKSNLPNCTFYKPASGLYMVTSVEEKIFELVSSNSLLKNPKRSQILLDELTFCGNLSGLMETAKMMGDEQFHDLQLLINQRRYRVSR